VTAAVTRDLAAAGVTVEITGVAAERIATVAAEPSREPVVVVLSGYGYGYG
jgi:hypothetical protein